MVFQKVICVGILHETNFNLFFIIHVIVILDNKLIDKCLYYVIHIHMSYNIITEKKTKIFQCSVNQF